MLVSCSVVCMDTPNVIVGNYENRFSQFPSMRVFWFLNLTLEIQETERISSMRFFGFLWIKSMVEVGSSCKTIELEQDSLYTKIVDVTLSLAGSDKSNLSLH